MLEDEENDSPFFHEENKSLNSGLWKSRFIIGLIMIAFSFVGLILSSLWQKGAWDYWRITIGAFTLLSIWLCTYVKKHSRDPAQTKLWQEISLWMPLYLSGAIFSLFVEKGIFNNLQSGYALLITMGMTLVIGGIFIEGSFIFSGLCMLAFAAGSAYLHSYLYTILLPIALLSIVALFLFSYLRRRHLG